MSRTAAVRYLEAGIRKSELPLQRVVSVRQKTAPSKSAGPLPISSTEGNCGIVYQESRKKCTL